MKKVLVTGSNGLLGQTLVNLLTKEPKKYDVTGFSKGKNRNEKESFRYISVDITQKKILYRKLREIKPDFIINTAAITNVDTCEKEKKACDQLNVNAVQYLVDFSKETNSHLIHISTDFIFDGKKGHYKEIDTPNPLSYYGLSKLKSEKIIANSTINYTILRTILVYGKVLNMSKTNIVLWVYKMLYEGKKITIVNDQYRMPTYVEDLASACKIVIDKKAIGTFNISSNQLLSIYEIAQLIAEVFELNKNLIQAISTTTLNQTALRPVKTGFDLSKTKQNLGLYPKSFKEDLLRFKETLT